MTDLTDEEPMDEKPAPRSNDETDPETDTGEDRKGSAPVPFAPDKDDDSPLGDTDQHSDA